MILTPNLSRCFKHLFINTICLSSSIHKAKPLQEYNLEHLPEFCINSQFSTDVLRTIHPPYLHLIPLSTLLADPGGRAI